MYSDSEEEGDSMAIDIRCSWNPHYSNVYTVKCLDEIIYTTVTSDWDEVDSWVDRVRKRMPCRLRNFIVGFGIQWQPYTRSTANSAPIATIQICVKKSCLIYQLLDDKHSIPTSLRNLLESDIKFAVARFNVDQLMLSSQLGIHIEDYIEVSRHPSNGNQYSMEDMARMFLDFDGYPGEMKPTDIGRSNWEEEELSMAQVMYAAVDAFVSLRLGIFLVDYYN